VAALRNGFRSIGLTSPRIIGFTDPRANSQAFFLTANTETTYGTTMLDLKAWGPTVVEAPRRRCAWWMISGSAMSPTWASQARTRARAASTFSCPPL
jgi:hypothetical protein